jgi:hypothetical protein
MTMAKAVSRAESRPATDKAVIRAARKPVVDKAVRVVVVRAVDVKAEAIKADGETGKSGIKKRER